jgi:hypothetical protein
MNLYHECPILLIGGLAMKADEHSDLAGFLGSKTGRRMLYFNNLNFGDGPRIERDKWLAFLDQPLQQWENMY